MPRTNGRQLVFMSGRLRYASAESKRSWFRLWRRGYFKRFHWQCKLGAEFDGALRLGALTRVALKNPLSSLARRTNHVGYESWPAAIFCFSTKRRRQIAIPDRLAPHSARVREDDFGGASRDRIVLHPEPPRRRRITGRADRKTKFKSRRRSNRPQRALQLRQPHHERRRHSPALPATRPQRGRTENAARRSLPGCAGQTHQSKKLSGHR